MILRRWHISNPDLERVENELKIFDTYKRSLAKTRDLLHFDEFGFSIGMGTRAANEAGKMDLLITGLVHGDEVLGLEVINRVLKKLPQTSIKIGFLLCNVAAARAGQRFLETDLNRSFIKDKIHSLEEKRAAQITKIVSQARVVIDLHQTVEPTAKSFYCVVKSSENIRWAKFLDPDLGIVTFSALGFSHSGKTLTEQVELAGGVGLVVEWGQKGFSSELSNRAEKYLVNCIGKISRGEQPEVTGRAETFYLNDFIKNENDAELVAGLENFMPIKKGHLIARSKKGDVLSPYDGFVLFPKYGDLARVSPELCEVAIAETFSW